jgi:hypothetical protein
MGAHSLAARCGLGIGIGLILLGSTAWQARADQSPFDFAEAEVQPSPSDPRKIKLPDGETLVDFDVAPTRPEAAIISKTVSGKQKLNFWKFGPKDGEKALVSWEIPSDTTLSAITWHPLGNKLFFLSARSGQQEILTTALDAWKPIAIYKSKANLRRLVVGPRPFETGYDSATRTTHTSYRVFFGVRKPDGKYSTHTVTESGEREYAVLDSKQNSFQFADSDVQPNVLIASSALPVGFHPAGHFMIWEDEKHCFQKAEYGHDNWASSAKVFDSKSPCSGSLTYTPNGAAVLHWQSGSDGATLKYDRGEKSMIVAKGFRFLSTPSSVPDGKGVVGATKDGHAVTLNYVPIDAPLADVVNAWMFLESPKDRELLTNNTGLFRPLKTSQLYEIYDSESYHCGGYDQSTPSRPYLVSTDIFWELYSAAFEGIFILSERQAAVPKFWDFVQKADQSLKQKNPNSKLAKAFAVLSALRNGSSTANPEVAKIMKAEGTSVSAVTGEDFDFGNLKPRSHYTAGPSLQNYFRASKYLMAIKLDDTDVSSIRSLPESVIKAALAWVKVYEPFIAPSRRPLVWDKSNSTPAYAAHPDTRAQVFPFVMGLG